MQLAYGQFVFFCSPHLAVLLQRCSCLLPSQVLQVGQGVVKLAAVIHQDVQVPLWLVGCMGHVEGMVVVACCSAHLHMEVRLDISSLCRATLKGCLTSIRVDTLDSLGAG